MEAGVLPQSTCLERACNFTDAAAAVQSSGLSLFELNMEVLLPPRGWYTIFTNQSYFYLLVAAVFLHWRHQALAMGLACRCSGSLSGSSHVPCLRLAAWVISQPERKLELLCVE